MRETLAYGIKNHRRVTTALQLAELPTRRTVRTRWRWPAVGAYALAFGYLLGSIVVHSTAGMYAAVADVIAIGIFIAITRPRKR